MRLKLMMKCRFRISRVGFCSVLWCLLLFMPAGVRLARAANDSLAEARTLAYRGKEHRDEALALLRQYLADSPDNTDARTFYGIVLSWQGRYDEAREQLNEVVDRYPHHADAVPALINVELWSDHPDRAEALARNALAVHPNDISMLLADARALRNLNRRSEALAQINRVLALDPHNREAKQIRRGMVESAKWEASFNHTYDWFSDGRSPQHESSLSLRGPTPWGSLTASFNRADRYSLTSYQTDLDFYPHIRPGTYGYVNFGYSADGNLYPAYRAGGDLYQSLGHGFEISGGFRRLAFSTGINIYTFSFGKYYQSWLFTARGFVTPGEPGTSGTAVFSARRFFGSEGQHDYLEFRYSRGASPAFAKTIRDIEVLDSSRFTVEFDKMLHGGWYASLGGAVSQEQRIALENLRRYSLQGSIYYRF